MRHQRKLGNRDFYAVLTKEWDRDPGLQMNGGQFTERTDTALASVAQWIKYRIVSQNVAGLILGQGTCLSCRTGPQLGLCKRQSLDVSLPLGLPPVPSL